MCLLDARCRCENGQCSHNGMTSPFLNLPFTQLITPQNKFLDQTTGTQADILHPLVKKLKRDNGDFNVRVEDGHINGNKEQFNEQSNNQNNNNTFSFQTGNLLPLLSQLQPLNMNNNNNSNQFLMKQQLPFSAPSNGMTQAPSNVETILKDMQARVMGMFAFQSKMLTDLQEKSNLQAQTITHLLDEIKIIRKTVQSNQNDNNSQPLQVQNDVVAVQPIYTQLTSNDNCSLGGPISPHSLIQFLFKKKDSDYKYKLILNSTLEQPLYRERNFSLNVSLVDRQDNQVRNFNRIPLNISIYTSEQPPKFIDTNTSGNKILKGFTEKDLQQGQIIFDKIQIKEVTSHFRNGWVYLLIFPKALNYESGKTLHRKEDIDISEIRPLVIEKVVVKAKKLKDGKKGGSKDSDDRDDDQNHSQEKIEEN